MRALLIFVISLMLAACGGGGGSGSTGGSSPIGSTLPVGTVAGTTFDGLISNGVVTVYDFTNGTKGEKLGQATSDSTGRYSISLQVMSRPILVEMTGGFYTEEAGMNAQVTLDSNHKLSALANYTTGSAIRMGITTFTHLAAGLAEYEISKGKGVAAAIDEANNRVSSLVGLNVLTVTPLQITDTGNASATLTPELTYGFLESAISMWTYNHAQSAATQHVVPFTSIDFAQLLYQDVSADGLLDGLGRDSTGNSIQLSFGTFPLGVDVYRMGLGLSLVQMAASTNNKTGLTGAQVLNFSQSFVGNMDAMFNNVAPSTITVPVATINTPTANTKVNGVMNVAATTQSVVGLSKVELLVDGAIAATATTNLTAPSFQINTTAYADGLRTIDVRATDLAGQVSDSSVQVLLDNVAPVVYISNPTANSKLNGMVTVAATAHSVAGLSKVELEIDGTTVATASNLSAPTFQLNTAAYLDGTHVIGVRATDGVGLVSISTIQATFANFVPVVNISTPLANVWVSRAISVAATAQSTIGLSSVVLLVDGTSVGTAANLTTPSFQLDTTTYADGAHTVAVSATDVDGLLTTSTVSINIDNTPPTTTDIPSLPAPWIPTMNGCATDSGSGILSVTDVVYGTALALNAQGCWASSHTLFGAGAITSYPIIVRDKANNCSYYLWSLKAPTLWALTSSGPC